MASRDNLRSRALIHEKPDLFNALLEKITHVTIAYLQAQIDAGADALQLLIRREARYPKRITGILVVHGCNRLFTL